MDVYLYERSVVMIKKYMAIMLAGLMLASTVVGCEKNNKPADNESVSTTMEDIKDTSAVDETEESATTEVTEDVTTEVEKSETTTDDMEGESSAAEESTTIDETGITSEAVTEPSVEEKTEPFTEPSLEGKTEPVVEPTKGSEQETSSANVEGPTTFIDKDGIIWDWYPVEMKNPSYVYGRYEYVEKTVGGKTVHCLYKKDVQYDYEWQSGGDEYYIKWNDWLYLHYQTIDNYGPALSSMDNKDEEYEGVVLNDQSYNDIPHITKFDFSGWGKIKVDDREINIGVTYLKPYFYDEKTQTITTKSEKFVPKDIYLNYIAKYLENKTFEKDGKDDYDQLIKELIIEEAGYCYDIYIFWYYNLRGTEFDFFVTEGVKAVELGYNGVDKYVGFSCNYGNFDYLMEEVNRIREEGYDI